MIRNISSTTIERIGNSNDNLRRWIRILSKLNEASSADDEFELINSSSAGTSATIVTMTPNNAVLTLIIISANVLLSILTLLYV